MSRRIQPLAVGHDRNTGTIQKHKCYLTDRWSMLWHCLLYLTHETHTEHRDPVKIIVRFILLHPFSEYVKYVT